MRYLAVSLIIFSYLILCWLCWRNYQRKQHISRSVATKSEDYILIGYASQTGSAFNIAQQTADQLEQAGKSVQILPLNQINPAQLTLISTTLFIVSTYGEGEAPDNGNRFIARTLAQLDNTSLQNLQIAILALGDSSYQHFCGFAHQLHNKLHQCGAHFLTDIIEVDQLDESALRHWQYYLGQLSGNTHFSDWSKPAYEHWKIIARECVNPASPGAPVYHLQLQPCSTAEHAQWQAGDIVEIGPRNSPDLPHREYSIASVPSGGTLDLLVRQVRDGNGQLGLGSGWLTEQAPLNSAIQLRIRSNPHFHSPDASRPLILIGNGTGIAGLRAHIANPARCNAKHWLFFGERSATADQFFHADIQRWQHTGLLTRVDKVFSRDAASNPVTNAPRYVQDLLLPNAQAILRWVDEDAAIFVCGSLTGMAQAVDDALAQILGADRLERLADEQRYCRDVY